MKVKFSDLFSDLVEANRIEKYFLKLDCVLEKPMNTKLRLWLLSAIKVQNFTLPSYPIIYGGRIPFPVSDYIFVVNGEEMDKPPVLDEGRPSVECLFYRKNGIHYLYRYIP